MTVNASPAEQERVNAHRDELITALMSRVEMVPEAGCWIWMGATNGPDKYGMINNAQFGKWATHRLSYWLFVGPIPDGLWVLHSCDVPPCVNPAHLFVGSRSDNMRDCARKGRMGVQQRPDRAFFSTPRGKTCRSFGERHFSAKITDAQVAEIRELAALGESQYRLAAKYGVTQPSISQIVRRKIRVRALAAPLSTPTDEK